MVMTPHDFYLDGQVGADTPDSVESRPEPMWHTVEDEHDEDSKNEEKKESGASIGHALRILRVLQPAFSNGSLTAGRMSEQEVIWGRLTIRSPPRSGFA